MALPPATPNQFSTGLCDWCAAPGGCGICLYACVCQPCFYGSEVEMLPPAVCCGGSWAGGCLAFCGMSMIGWPCVLQMITRGFIRTKYGIPGNPVEDCCVTCWCSPCAMCQEYRECKIRGLGPGGVELGAVAAPPPPPVQPPAPQAMSPDNTSLMYPAAEKQ